MKRGWPTLVVVDQFGNPEHFKFRSLRVAREAARHVKIGVTYRAAFALML